MSPKTVLFNTPLYLRHLSNTYAYCRSRRRLPNYVEPRSFSEKVQWRKLFDRNPLFPCFVDKLAVRNYIGERAPALKFPRILWTGTDPEAIPYAELPERFVIKPSHRSGDVLFVNSRESHERARVVAECRRWLTLPYGRSRREWAYQDLQGRLMVEELLETDPDRRFARDYRCHVVNGTVAAILINLGQVADMIHRFVGEALVFDRAGRRLPYRRLFDERQVRASFEPSGSTQMVAAAEALGKDIDYVRVDFYLIDQAVYFNELTVYPGSGMNKVDIDPTIGSPATEPFDIFLGKEWTLPSIALGEQMRRGLLS